MMKYDEMKEKINSILLSYHLKVSKLVSYGFYESAEKEMQDIVELLNIALDCELRQERNNSYVFFDEIKKLYVGIVTDKNLSETIVERWRQQNDYSLLLITCYCDEEKQIREMVQASVMEPKPEVVGILDLICRDTKKLDEIFQKVREKYLCLIQRKYFGKQKLQNLTEYSYDVYDLEKFDNWFMAGERILFIDHIFCAVEYIEKKHLFGHFVSFAENLKNTIANIRIIDYAEEFNEKSVLDIDAYERNMAVLKNCTKDVLVIYGCTMPEENLRQCPEIKQLENMDLKIFVTGEVYSETGEECRKGGEDEETLDSGLERMALAEISATCENALEGCEFTIDFYKEQLNTYQKQHLKYHVDVAEAYRHLGLKYEQMAEKEGSNQTKYFQLAIGYWEKALEIYWLLYPAKVKGVYEIPSLNGIALSCYIHLCRLCAKSKKREKELYWKRCIVTYCHFKGLSLEMIKEIEMDNEYFLLLECILEDAENEGCNTKRLLADVKSVLWFIEYEKLRGAEKSVIRNFCRNEDRKTEIKNINKMIIIWILDIYSEAFHDREENVESTVRSLFKSISESLDIQEGVVGSLQIIFDIMKDLVQKQRDEYVEKILDCAILCGAFQEHPEISAQLYEFGEWAGNFITKRGDNVIQAEKYYRRDVKWVSDGRIVLARLHNRITNCYRCEELEEMVKKIKKSVDFIRETLRLKEVPVKLVYYTSFSTLRMMFPGVNQDYAGKFAVMNVSTMNDPEEGRVVLEYLMGTPGDFWWLPKVKSEDRKRMVIETPLVFSRCFTTEERMDDLPMWEMYGDHAAGCCVVVDGAKLQEKKPDLFYVCYLQHNGERLSIPGMRGNNDNVQRENSVRAALETLKMDLGELKENLKKLPDDMGYAKEEVESAVRVLLDRIAYMFKKESYEHENEIRLIYSFGDFDDRMSSTPFRPGEMQNKPVWPKLYIIPDMDICISEIILGPKFPDADICAGYIAKEIKKMQKQEVLVTKSGLSYK